MLAKRGFDLVAALAGLLLLAPLMLVLAAWIKYDSRGPVLFRQRRVGRNGVPFEICKFRTMAPAAEQAGQLSLADDGRATRAGRLLRRTKLDELPQLLNVVLGEMSLVGPRPEVPRYVAHYPPAVRDLVLSVAPGITDWAALHFRDEGELLRRAADAPEQAYLQQILPVKLDYYVRYVQRRSFLGDLHILVRTVATVLGGLLAPLMPALRLSGSSRPAPHEWQSLLISSLRALAALQVAAAHLRAQVFPGLATLADPPLWYLALSFATGFAHQAVVVFFLLSGWLVGGSLLDRLGRAGVMADYAIDRLTRLWLVLLPTFLLMLLLGLGAGVLDPHRPSLALSEPWSLTVMLGNLFGLQTMAVPVFGGNFPLWSLANESWYYLLFPLLVLSLRRGRAATRLGAAAAALLIAALLDPLLMLYFSLWLLGAGASRVRVGLGRAQGWGAGLLFAGLAVWLRLQGQDGDLSLDMFWGDLMYSLLFLLLLCSASGRHPTALRPLAQWAGLLAGFSFTLYVLHVPLQQALWAYRNGPLLAPDKLASLAVYAAMLAMIVALCYLFHLPFEAQTSRLRRFIRRRWPAPDAGRTLATPADAG